MPVKSEAQRRLMEAVKHNPAFAAKTGIPRSVAREFVGDARIRGAGVALSDPGGRFLFVRRGMGGDHPGEWAFPGGRLEDGEDHEQAALRELLEETGHKLDSTPIFLHRTLSDDGVDFTTFGARVPEQFTPALTDEHTEYQWAQPHDPPTPLHSGVSDVLRTVALAEDGGDMLAIGAGSKVPGADRSGGRDAKPLAFDRASVRSYRKDGHLHVEVAHLSKAAVNEYRGIEIPQYASLGLDPKKLYRMLRDPAELEAAAPTFNKLPILDRHVPVSADAHPGDITIGTTGDHATFENGYLDNSLAFWTQGAIDDIESGRKKQLSCAYHYRAEMKPGTFEGQPYDGIMRDIVGNHLALVKEGRAGDDIVVGDSMENLMSKTLLSRKAAFMLGACAAALGPVLAQDSKVNIAPLFVDVTAKNYAAKKAAIKDGLTKLTEGKLAQDASLDSVMGLLDKLEDVKPAEGKDAMSTEQNGGLPVALGEEDTSMDADNDVVAKIKAMLEAAGVDPAIIAKCDEVAGAGAEDADPDAEKKPDDDKKPAMDEAAVQKVVTAAVERTRNEAKALRQAAADVEPYIGKTSLALDSADQVYAAAFKALGVNITDVPKEGYRALLLAIPKPGRKAPALAQDAKGSNGKSFAERFPGADRIQVM